MRKLPHTAAEDLLEIIMRRYERFSTLLTSNRPVEAQGKLLGDVAAVSAAMLDRLLHHGHVSMCGPRSWRTKRSYDRAITVWLSRPSVKLFAEQTMQGGLPSTGLDRAWVRTLNLVQSFAYSLSCRLHSAVAVLLHEPQANRCRSPAYFGAAGIIRNIHESCSFAAAVSTAWNPAYSCSMLLLGMDHWPPHRNHSDT